MTLTPSGIVNLVLFNPIEVKHFNDLDLLIRWLTPLRSNLMQPVMLITSKHVQNLAKASRLQEVNFFSDLITRTFSVEPQVPARCSMLLSVSFLQPDK